MPPREYRIYIKGTLSFVKFTKQDFESICETMDILGISYTTEVINLI